MGTNAKTMPEKTAGTNADNRWRFMFKFWLDHNNPLDRWVGDYLTDMKAARKMTQTIRDAIRLIADLRAGNVEVLCELFPWLSERLDAQPVTAGDAFGELVAKQQAEMDAMRAKLDALAARTEPLLQQLSLPFTPPAIANLSPSQAVSVPNPPIIPPELAANPAIVASDTLTAPLSDATPVPRPIGPKPMAAANTAIPGPALDDDDALLAIRKDESAGKRAAANFLSSVQALVNA